MKKATAWVDQMELSFQGDYAPANRKKNHINRVAYQIDQAVDLFNR